jgi:hypothetical protein
MEENLAVLPSDLSGKWKTDLNRAVGASRQADGAKSGLLATQLSSWVN